MKKVSSNKLALRRLTVSQLVKPTGGWTPSLHCWGSRDADCSNSCNSCEVYVDACLSQGDMCTQFCPPDLTQGYTFCDCF